MEGRERGHVEVMKEKSRMHLRAIEAYNDLRKRSTARYAEYEASIKLRDETESQLRNQLQGVTEELHTSRQAVAEKTDELNQLRVLLREETLGKLVTEKPVDFVGFDNVVEFNKNRQNDDNVVKSYKGLFS